MDYLWFLIAGAVGGILGGMGMGGGTLLIPILTFFLDVTQKNAQAFNLISFVPMAIIALILHAKNKLIALKGMLPLIISAVISSLLGGFAVSFIEGDLQTKLFGGFLVLLAIVKFILTVKNKSSKPANE
ncbi:MAG: sulfite exporter TauE/SafE family protein [Clostridiales bacterium]|nr:sulfite exporter TauE/SafE family protein [Clostridiales bacterium]